MAAIFQIRRGTTNINIADGEIYFHKGSGSIQFGSGSNNPITLLPLNAPVAGDIDLIGNISASGDVRIGGNIYLGNATADNISALGQFNTNLVPSGTIDVGTTTAYWRNVYATNISGALAATNGVVSGSSQITLESINGFTTFNTTLSTITGSLISTASANTLSISNLNTFSGSQLTKDSSLATITGSLISTASNHEQRLVQIETKSGSYDTRFTSLATISGSLISTASNHEQRLGQIETKSGSYDTRFTSLATISGSLILTASANTISISNLNTFSSSQLTKDTNLSTISGSLISTASANTISITELNSYSASLKTAIGLSGTNVTVLGNLTVNGTTTQVNSTTLNIGDNIVELNYGGSQTTAGIYAKDASVGGSNVSGSLLWDASVDYWKAGPKDAESKILLAGGDSVISSSAQLTDLNTFTASANIRLNNLESTSASVNTSVTNLNLTTASLNTSVSNINASTSSLNTFSGSVLSALTSIYQTTASLNEWTASAKVELTNLELKSASVDTSISNINTNTASVNVSIANLNTETASIESRFTTLSLYTASVNQTTASLNSYTASANAWSGTIDGRFITLSSYTASVNQTTASLNEYTASANAWSGTIDTRFSTLSQVTSSLIAATASLYGSASNHEIRLDELEYTTSVNLGNGAQVALSELNRTTASLNVFTASVSGTNAWTASTDIRLSNLELTTASLNISVSNINTTTASLNTSVSNINTTTASLKTSITELNTYSASLKTAIGVNGSNVTINGDLSVLGTTTQINSTQVNIGENILELNYGGSATTSGIYTKDATGVSTTSGSLLWNATDDMWIAGKKGTEAKVLTDGMGVISGSGQLSNYETTGRGIVSGSSQITPLLPVGTVSGSSQVIGILSSLNTFTSSLDATYATEAEVAAGYEAKGRGIWSGSAQLPSGVVSGSSQISGLSNAQLTNSSITIAGTSVSLGSSITAATILNGTNVISSSTQITSLLPAGVVSGSSQIDLTATTNYASGILTRLNAVGVISGSSQISLGSATGNIALATQTTGDYVASLVQGTGVTITNNSGENSTPTIAIGQAVGTSANVQFSSIGVGTTASGTAGEIRATGDITAYYSSDIRLKENIVPIPNALEKVNQISGNTYDWKEGYDEVHSHKGNDVGVIAQEVEAILPQIVTNRDTGFKAVQYEKIIPLLIEAIKELSAKVDRLENK
jgi:cytoskeletal protein CcmA (bactofilin family)